MRKFHELLFVFLAVVLGIFYVSSVLGDVLTTQIVLDKPANETYFNVNRTDFNMTITGVNESYDIELIINSTRYGIRNALNATSTNITMNQTLADGNNYTWRFNVTNGTQTNSSLTRVFTIDTTLPLITYVSPTLANGSTDLVSRIYVNVSITDSNFRNITFLLKDSTGVTVNTSTFTNLTVGNERFMNYTGLSEGSYTYNVSVTDAANNRNTSIQRTVDLDLIGPVVLLVAPANGSYRNNNDVSFVCNTTDGIQLANVSLFHNLTGTFSLNQSSTLSGTSNSSNFSFADVADGRYAWNCRGTDTSNQNTTNSTNFTVIVDTAAPSPLVSASPTSVIQTETVTLSCTSSDGLDPAPTATLSVKIPGSSTFSAATSPYITDTTGTYTARCASTDAAGNSQNADTTFSVSAASSSGGSSGGGGGGSDTTTEEVVTEEVVSEEVPTSFDESTTWADEGTAEVTSAETGDVFSFAFVAASGETEDHSITITAIDEDAGTVTLMIASTAQEVTVAIGEQKDVDLDGDGVNDLGITLRGITEGMADLYFTKLGVWVSTEEVSVPTEELVEERAWSPTMIYILAGILVVILAVVGYIFFRERGKRVTKKR